MANTLTPRAAAEMLAAVMTAIEGAGIEIRESSITLVDRDDVAIATTGWAEGDPWAVMGPGQRVTPRGIEDE